MSSGLDLVAGPRLELLGGFQLQSCGEVLAVPPRVQRLLAFMALQRRPLHRAYVAGRLWLDLSQDQAHGCLRTALWRAAALRAPVVAATATHVSLAPALASGRLDDRTVYSETLYPRLHFGWSDLASAIDGRYHYVRAPRAELYDTTADRRERTNLAGEKASTAAALDSWHEEGKTGERPAGRVRRHRPERVRMWQRAYAAPLYRLLIDPDGRPSALRRQNRF